jgi:hypothetical protein
VLAPPQGAAPVAEGAGDTEQRIRRTVPSLPCGNLTVAVLKSQLQMYGGAMFVLDVRVRYKALYEHIFNRGAIKRAELLDAWRRFMDTPGDQGGFDPARMLSDEEFVVRKAAQGSRARRGAAGTRRGAAATVPTAHLPEHVDPLRFHAAGLYLDRWKQWIGNGNVTPDNMATSRTDPVHIGPVHVDQKIVKEVLSAATGDTTDQKQTQRIQNWCKFIVQSPHHKGGYAIIPTTASGLAAFYSATAKFVTLVASLPHGGAWVRGGQDLTVHDT